MHVLRSHGGEGSGVMTDQLPSKEKLPDWLRRWYCLKGEPRFREAADEIERLEQDLTRTESARVAILAENTHYKCELTRTQELLNSAWFQRVTYKQQVRELQQQLDEANDTIINRALPPLKVTVVCTACGHLNHAVPAADPDPGPVPNFDGPAQLPGDGA